MRQLCHILTLKQWSVALLKTFHHGFTIACTGLNTAEHDPWLYPGRCPRYDCNAFTGIGRSGTLCHSSFATVNRQKGDCAEQYGISQ